MIRKLLSIAIILSLFNLEGTHPPASFNFIVVDLKYNQEEGVKICELQSGIFSAFKGYDFLIDAPGTVSKKVVDLFEQFNTSIWVDPGSIADPGIRNEIKNRKLSFVNSYQSLCSNSMFNAEAEKSLSDPYDLNNYHALLIAKPRFFKGHLKKFKAAYPNVLILNGDCFPFWRNKHKISQLFQGTPELEKLKPFWKLYTKETSKTENRNSNHAFHSNYVVIKPVNSLMGQGVILLERGELPNILEMIRLKNKKLKQHKEPSYRYWSRHCDDPLIVEEFHYSDPVAVSHLDNRLFDATLRLAFMIWYEHGEYQMEFVEMHWKLPKKSLDESGSFIDLHKSNAKAPYYALVEPEQAAVIKQTLLETMPIFFSKILDNTKPRN